MSREKAKPRPAVRLVVLSCDPSRPSRGCLRKGRTPILNPKASTNTTHINVKPYSGLQHSKPTSKASSRNPPPKLRPEPNKSAKPWTLNCVNQNSTHRPEHPSMETKNPQNMGEDKGKSTCLCTRLLTVFGAHIGCCATVAGCPIK